MDTGNDAQPRPSLTDAKRALLEKRLRGEAAGRAASTAITRLGGDGPVPLSLAQEHLWFMAQMEPGNPVYHLPAAIRLLGPLDVSALERALNDVVARHGSLRTVFPLVDGKPMQRVLPEVHVPVPVIDVPEVPGEDREATLARMLRDEGGRPFDLENGPVARGTVFRLSPTEHVFLQNIHHLVSDGWSQGLFSRELSAFFAHHAFGAPAPDLPPIPIEYTDFARWQREALAGTGVFDRDLEYWRRQLAGAPPLEMPTDRPRPRVMSYRGSMYRFPFGEDLAEALRRLAADEGVSMHMLMMAGLSATLLHYTGQEDQVLGSLLGGRGRPETERVIGYFVNLAAIRVDLSGRPTFRQLLRRVRDLVLDSDRYGAVPFARLVAEMGAQGDLSRHPIIQAMVFVHNFVRDTVPLRDEGGEEDPTVLRSVPMYTGMEVGLVDTGTSKFDFGFSLHDIPGSLTGFVEYNTDLFDASTMEALVARYLRVLRQVTADPGTGVWELDLMDAGERRRVREEWNATARPYPPGDTVPSLFAAQAARAPDAVAVAAPRDGSLTYAALAERSGRLAESLRGLGVGPETRVGVCVERGPEMVVALLAVLRAGGAYVPLDPEYPAERLAWMLADSAVPVLLTQAPLVERLPAHGARTVLLDGPLPAPSRANEFAATTAQSPPARTELPDASDSPAEHDVVLPSPLVGEGPGEGGARGAPEPTVHPDNLAYVIYTSGSTGRPKGVMVEHRNLANLLLGTRDAFGLREGDVYPALGSFAFDISLMEMFAPLVTGGTVRVVERERVVDVERLVEELAGSTVLHVVPAVMRRAAAAVRAGRGTLPGMQRILVGGDVVAPDLVPEIRAAFPGAEVRIMYGPTETTVLATGHLVDAEETVDRPLMGAPLPNVRAYVCGGDGELVPPGVPGELWLGGRGVARGYLGRPELTAEKFVPDPFSGEPGARLYRTGDRARWLAEGTMEFLGRVDAQVKVRGFRIEPGEVEAALAAHPAVRESVVAALGDPGDAWLAGYVVPAEGAAPDPAELRAWLAERLPEHMVPGAVVVMDAFPLNGSGKVDRRALPAPEAAGREEYVAPRTPAEETVASVWAEVLEVERVGARDSFFTLGGHSLLATQVISRLRALLGVEVPLRVVFEEATVERLAARVDELLAEGPAAGPAPITRRAREVRKPGAPAPG